MVTNPYWAALGLEAPVEELAFRDFYKKYAAAKDWHDAEQLRQAARYQTAFDLLAANLRGLRVYRVGKIEISIIVVGKSAASDWLGLATRAVET